jgi:aquaporin Z
MSDSTRTWIAEILGTFILVFGGGLAILSVGGGDVVAIAFGFGLSLLIALYAFGEISGGHFNPAVSLAALLDGRISVETFIQYVVAQSGGAVLAGVAILAASSQESVASTATKPGAVSAGEAFLLELLLTAFFVAVILKVTTSDTFSNSAFGAISFSYVAIHLAAVPLSGASVNPARTLGSALVGSEFTDFWVYVTAPFIGAALGWVFYRAITTESGEKPLE